MKRCTRCGEIKTVVNFSETKRNGKKYLESWCKECHNIYAKEYRKRKPEPTAKGTARVRKRLYGISPSTYDKMFVEQGGVCAICKGVNENRTALSLDHSHESGQIRGLLCTKCNHALGNMRDSIELLRKAAFYLFSYKSKETA